MALSHSKRLLSLSRNQYHRVNVNVFKQLSSSTCNKVQIKNLDSDYNYKVEEKSNEKPRKKVKLKKEFEFGEKKNLKIESMFYTTMPGEFIVD